MNQEQAEWEWQQSNSVLVVSEDQKLQLLTQPLTFANKKIAISFNVKQWKPFHFSGDIGWNWHKSWNMPEIECTVHVNGEVDQTIINQISLQVTFYVTKTNYQSMALQSVGCRGQAECQIQNGVCVFKSLKFNTTSYKNEYQKFQLVFVLSQMVDNQMQVLSALISPCIFVDSRKHARIQVISNPIQLIVDPFLPENLERVLVKKRKKNSPNASQEITSDAQGLANYFTAQNIRHKIKHPLFLAIRFYECVKLFMNSDISEYSVINEVQKFLIENSSQKEQNENKMALLINIPQGCSNELQNKILCIISQMENKYFQIFTEKNLIPQNLIEISNIHTLKNKYKQLYPSLIKSKYGMGSQNDMIDYLEDKTSLKIVKGDYQESVQKSQGTYSQTEYLNQCYNQQLYQQQQQWYMLQNQRQFMYYYGMPEINYYPRYF